MISTRTVLLCSATAVLGLVLGLRLQMRAAPVDLAASCSVPAIDPRQVCAVENSIQGRDGVPFELDGNTYWVCCPRCAETFKQNPDAYRFSADPVSGQQVDKAAALPQPYAGRVYFFASEATRTAFNADPGRWKR
jgi:YHS domain-containing protein